MSQIIGKLAKFNQAAQGSTEPVFGSVEFALCGYGSNLPRVPNQYSIGAATESIDIPTNGDGTFETYLVGNDIINPPGTYYTFTVKDDNGDILQCTAHTFINGDNYDMDNEVGFDPSSQSPPAVPIVLTNQLQIQNGGNPAQFDANHYQSFKMILNQDAALQVSDNQLYGNLSTFIIQQNSVGGHSLIWGDNFYNASQINMEPHGITIQTFVYTDGNVWYPIAPATWYSPGGGVAPPTSQWHFLRSVESDSGPTPAMDTTGTALLICVTANSGTTPTDSENNTWIEAITSGTGTTSSVFYCISPVISTTHTFAIASGVLSALAFSVIPASNIQIDQTSTATGTTSAIAFAPITPATNSLIITGISNSAAASNSIGSFMQAESMNQGAAAYQIQLAPTLMTPTWTVQPEGSPWKLLAHTSNQGNGTVAMTVNTTGATLIVVLTAYYGPAGFSISDNASNAWTLGAHSDTTAGIVLRADYVANPVVGNGHLFNINATQASVMVLAYQGTGTTTADKTSVNSIAGTVSSIQPGAITPSANDSVVVAGCTSGHNINSIDSGFTIEENLPSVVGSFFALAGADLLKSGSSALNPIWQIIQANGPIAAQMSFTKQEAPVTSAASLVSFTCQTAVPPPAPTDIVPRGTAWLDSRSAMTLDCLETQCFTIMLRSNVNQMRVKNICPGVTYTFIIHQTGEYKFTWPSVCINGPDIRPIANSVTVANFIGLNDGTMQADSPGTQSGG